MADAWRTHRIVLHLWICEKRSPRHAAFGPDHHSQYVPVLQSPLHTHVSASECRHGVQRVVAMQCSTVHDAALSQQCSGMSPPTPRSAVPTRTGKHIRVTQTGRA